jgi:type IV secretory pathway VirB2 component (pilin)
MSVVGAVTTVADVVTGDTADTLDVLAIVGVGATIAILGDIAAYTDVLYTAHAVHSIYRDFLIAKK